MTMDENNIREIARGHGWLEDEFLSAVKRLVKSYAYTPEGALAQAQRVFARKFGVKTKPEKKVDPQTKSAALGKGKPSIVVEPEGPPRTVEEVGNDDAGPRIDSELSSWLVGRGFVRGPEGVAYIKTDKVGEDTVKLQIDFSDDARGMRYGYRLNLQTDPPEWKSDKALRDHPTLLEYKRYRDDLLTQRERAKAALPKAKSTEVPAGGGTTLALLPPSETEEAKEIKRRDEAFIMGEIKGDLKVLERALADYFYSFKLGNRTITGLSYAGVKAIIRRMGHIAILEIKVEEKAKSWFVLVKAHDKLKDLEAYGAAVQPKQFQGGGENPFALTVAVSKAQRNAWRHFIDEKIVTAAYRTWLEERRR